MKILIDTHCWLWLQAAPERFRPAVLETLQKTDNRLLFSAVSAWEIVIKYTLGKLPLPMPPAEYITSRLTSSDIETLPISLHHTLEVADLPHLHRDPFDRLLIAQALVERATLLTADRTVHQYDIETLPAS